MIIKSCADDSTLLSRYRDLVARIAVQAVGKINSLTFCDFLDDPVVTEHDTCYVDVRLFALYHDPFNDVLYEINSLVWLSPTGRVTVVDYNSDPVSSDDGGSIAVDSFRVGNVI